MTILIIGGSGFIGQHLCQALLKNDSKTINNTTQKVIIKTRNAASTHKVFKKQHDYSLAINHPIIIESYDDLVETPNIVISLAGAGIVDKRWTDSRKKELINSRLNPIQEFQEWLENRKPQNNNKIEKLIIGSAIGYYGYGGGYGDNYGNDPNTEYTEDSQHHDDFTHQICQQLETAGHSLSKYCNNIISLRTGVVLGNGAALAKMALPAKFHLNGKIGHGQQWVSWIHMQDWINATQYIFSLESPKTVYNLTSPNPVHNQDLSQAIGNALGKPFQIPVPAFSLKLLLGEASILLLGSQKVLPANLQAANFEFLFSDIEKACLDLL